MKVRWIATLFVALMALILIAGCAAAPKVCHQEAYQESYQRSIQVPYQEAVQSVEYLTYVSSMVSTSQDFGFDWELISMVYITNTDNVGGTFGMTSNYGGASVVSSQAYISPGQQVKISTRSSGLAYSTDFRTRYDPSFTVIVPTTIKTTMVTKYRTEYVIEYKTAYREVCV